MREQITWRSEDDRDFWLAVEDPRKWDAGGVPIGVQTKFNPVQEPAVIPRCWQ
jgi:hypothetical protein